MLLLRRDTAFSPESAAGSSEAGSYRSPFCASLRRGADRRWGFGFKSKLIIELQEVGRLYPPERVTGFNCGAPDYVW